MGTQRSWQRLVFLLVLLSLIGSADYLAHGTDPPRVPWEISSAVVGGAGAPQATVDHLSNGTLAQPTPIGIASNGTITLHAGFWGHRAWASQGMEESDDQAPRSFLSQSMPNPSRGQTSIRFGVGTTAPVSLRVFNIQGRLVRTLVHDVREPGQYAVFWDGRDDSGTPTGAGTYFYRLQVAGFKTEKKLLFLR
ncbi:FlgD immunoglobulin-like domain containing protein [Candidatus Eisenbacteria bacterium]|uniref:FlgD immunoglobulin-like domain containing protein n=1 Tax=Eiseniibacteriota bacterium TaxID=2212470 RepID=A0ABV6YJ47_UNCEI